MKQWMQENWAKLVVRTVLIVVAGAIFIPRMAAKLEAHEQAKHADVVSDSVLVKAGIDEWDYQVVDSSGIKTVVVKTFTATNDTGDTLTEKSADSICWRLDYHTQPLKVVLHQRTQQNGTTCRIAVVHIPYDIYRLIVGE